MATRGQDNRDVEVCMSSDSTATHYSIEAYGKIVQFQYYSWLYCGKSGIMTRAVAVSQVRSSRD